jgi:calpain-15
MGDDDFAGTDDAVAGTQAEGCEWSSLADIVPGCVLFANIDPSDLHQGQLGDCWLISAMASIAEYPDTVQDLIDDNGDGTYNVHLFNYAEEAMQSIMVNDQVPTQGGQPMFVQPTGQTEIWPCIIEKGFAKLSGGYAAIDGGTPIWAFGVMKGIPNMALFTQDDGDGPYTELDPTFSCSNVTDDMANGFPVGGDFDPDDMFEKLKDFNDKELLMAAGSNNGQDSEQSQQGVVQGHAYSILDVKEVGDYKLVQLRNPWGQTEYTGPWSDGSPEWDQNPDVASECGYTGPADDGKFWMPFDEFGKEYGSIGVCTGAAGGRNVPAGRGSPGAGGACGCVLQ